ncbi:MAG TPA: hypothetical protein VFB90_02070 [Dehalococcoidia bacterium]|nr:hypothetical protein [Dehalococcoidia bacterium]
MTPTRFSLTLPRQQARLVYIAVAYHLGRPGSELDPETLVEHDYGLRHLQPLLAENLGETAIALELTAFQMTRLESALLGALNELKMYSLLDAMAGPRGRQRSAVNGFDDALRSAFPEVASEPDYASQLAGEVMLLRRELDASFKRAAAVLAEERQAAEEARRRHKRPWQFWRR